MRLGLIFLVALAMAACGETGETSATPEEAPEIGIAMDAATQARVGVQVAPLEARAAPRAVDGYARVLDASPLAALDAEVRAAEAAASASRAEFERLKALAAADQAASQRAVEAARAQAEADAARANLASRRIGLEWGQGAANLTGAARGRLLNDLAAGRAALVRVDATTAPVEPKRVSLQLGGAESVEASVLGTAGPADQRLQTPGYLALVRGADASRLPSGRLIPARIEEAAEEEGVFVPEAAIVRKDGAAWIYAPIGQDRFERREVIDAHPVAGGLLATGGLSPGDRIVVAGAASLYAAEIGPAEEE